MCACRERTSSARRTESVPRLVDRVDAPPGNGRCGHVSYTQGFVGIMKNFNNERLMLAQNCVSMAQASARGSRARCMRTTGVRADVLRRGACVGTDAVGIRRYALEVPGGCGRFGVVFGAQTRAQAGTSVRQWLELSGSGCSTESTAIRCCATNLWI